MFLTLIAFSIVAMSPLEVTAQESQENEDATTTYNFTLTLNAKVEMKNAPVLTKPSQADADGQTVVTYYVGDLVVPINEEKKMSHVRDWRIRHFRRKNVQQSKRKTSHPSPT